jgi:hypothetical protein
MRRVSLSLSYNFGRPPQSARTNQGGGEEIPQDAGAAGGLR